MQKLTRSLNVFHQKDLATNQERTGRAFRFMEMYLPQMFPSAAAVQQWINNVKYAEYRPDQIYRAEFLPFHTRDNRWLAKYAAQIMKPENANIKFADVKNFVANSVAFDTARNQYELDLVKAQIQYMMINYAPNGLMSNPHRPSIKHRPYQDGCDFFRARVLNVMSTLGLHHHTIEVGLEANADLWRRQSMEHAFADIYESVTWGHYDETTQLMEKNHTNWQEMKRKEAQYRDIWLKLREYRYYFDHKAIIDELGTATDNMKMSPDKACQLNLQAVQWYKRYKNFTNPLYQQQQHDLTAELTR